MANAHRDNRLHAAAAYGMGQGGRQWVAMFQARFRDLSREALCDLDSLRDASTLGHQARHVFTGRQEAFVERFDPQPNDSGVIRNRST